MLDLEQIDRHQDRATRRFLAEHGAELADPPSMSPVMLANAATYCDGIDDPYSEELARRAGLPQKYRHASGTECADVVRRAAKAFNIILI